MACATNSMTLSQKINHNFSEQRISDMRDSCKVYDEVMIKHSFFFLSTYFAHKKDEPKVRTEKKLWHEDNVYFAESDNNI